MDKLLDALRETLVKLGLDESAVDAALQEAVAKAEGVEEKPAEGDPTVEPVPEELAQDPTPELVPTEGEGELVEGEPTPDEVVPVEGEPEVAPTEPVPPVEPEQAVPQFDPTQLIQQVSDLQGQLEEYKKANEGLLARVQALEEGLKSAGVIDGSNPATEVGDQMPSAAPQNPTEDVFGSVLSEINGHKRF